jgi:hypothetical protein
MIIKNGKSKTLTIRVFICHFIIFNGIPQLPDCARVRQLLYIGAPSVAQTHQSCGLQRTTPSQQHKK